MSGPLPFDDELLRFLRRSVPSVWALDQLMAMRRSGDRAWQTDELVLELRSNPGIVTSALAEFVRIGLVEEDEGRHRYRPATPALNELVERLADAYATFPVALVQIILAARDHDLQSFADAFRIAKKE